MKTIEIDNDIYAYLLSTTAYIGESASSILRRKLQLGGISDKVQPPTPEHELTSLLNSANMKFGTATDKFLAILSEAHRKSPKNFEKVLSIQGRDRVYFARSREEITRSGKSTQPLQIPGSQYWVMTNSPTSQKKTMVHQALQLLVYSDAACRDAVQAIS